MFLPEIYPCVLANNLDEYKTRLEMIENSSASWAQIDFMDGDFVNQLSVLPADIKEIKSSLKLEAHLMVVNPENYYNDLIDAGFRRILIHREIFKQKNQCAYAIEQARKAFPEVGLVINPDTEIEDFSAYKIDSLQCMAVHPGASGQLILNSIYDTIKEIKEQNPPFVIAVDGGVNSGNIQELRKVGVDRFIMASAIFADRDVNKNFQYFLQLITQGGI